MNERMAATIRLLDRVNAAHPWSHNAAFTPFVLRHARAVRRGGGTRALDIGCGTGALLRRLAGILDEVVGVEPDPATAARARRAVADQPRATVIESAFRPAEFGDETFDLVTLVAVLHHLPLAGTLEAVRPLLRPGGRLVVVGLARETRSDVLRSAVSALLTPVIGLIRHPRRASAPPEGMLAPTSESRETFDEIAAVARGILPGVRMRKRLFWRYTAVWISD
ncbi:class I SAM-dependent methyltransferase [Microbacterium sp. LWO14-1.2]|uniref:class I SAM-dependent methyltransferase n=1 Tax=Microbacterium sp. LWO14-1.2 TaxID=3135263 RepID=UPI003138DAF9